MGPVVTRDGDTASRLAPMGATMRWNLERLGEPGTLSLATALPYLPFGLAGPLLIDTARLGGALWGWVIVASLAQIALMVGYVIARRIIRLVRGVRVSRRRRP